MLLLFSRQMRKILALFLGVSLFAASPVFVHAQTGAYAEIASVEARDFPKITALMDVYDAGGKFVEGLAPGSLTAYEDGQPRPVDAVTELDVPVQFVVAVNPGPGLAVRDSNAAPRFTRVVETLNQWVNSQPPQSKDDMS